MHHFITDNARKRSNRRCGLRMLPLIVLSSLIVGGCGNETVPADTMTTAMDAVCSDFKAVILEDCATASSREIHERTLELYRRNVLYPLLRILTSQQLLNELK